MEQSQLRHQLANLLVDSRMLEYTSTPGLVSFHPILGECVRVCVYVCVQDRYTVVFFNVAFEEMGFVSLPLSQKSN